MAIKQLIKKSEARILIFLKNASSPIKYKTKMATSMNMDYGYLMRILNGLEAKEWVRKVKGRESKVFYELTRKAPLDKAKESLR